jgi:hypothetical protein
MKYFKILPAAASIIALTATIGFSRDMRESDEAAAFRIRVETRESKNSADDITAYALPAAKSAQTGQIYRVEIEHGYETRVVTIDAYTGKILGNAKGPDKIA